MKESRRDWQQHGHDDVKSYPLPNELPCSSVVSFLHWVVCMMYWYTDRVHGQYECM